MKNHSLRLQAAGAAAAVALLTGAAQAAPAKTALDSALDALRSNAGGALSYRADAVDAYTMLRAAGTAPLLTDDTLAAPLARATAFLNQFGAAVGVTDPAAELQLQRVSTDSAGNTHVHLNQVHAGLPVFGARLVVHMNDTGITGVSGVFVPNLAGLNTHPAISASAAQTAALNSVQKIRRTSTLTIQSTRLMVYRSGLLDLHEGQNYLAYEVMVGSSAGDVRERVILDAAQGGVINSINEIHTILNRAIFTPNQDVPPVITEGGATAPADIPLAGDAPSDPVSRAPRAPTDNLYIFAGGTYELYRNLFGQEGYDDGFTPPEEQQQKSVYLVNDQCPNAYWNGDSTNYCPGFDADDVVSHEWSHAYTEYTHGLIYQYQSGALNESYSDIFGETYDLVNGIEGPLGVSLTEGDYYENGGSRWVMGEDLSDAAAAVLLRDMWDPDAFPTPSPGSVIESPNYYCGSSDGGGVHTNSGVPNHAYAMLVDGKEFNGVQIPAIGLTRAAHIYFQAETHYQTPTTNFAQHADALEQSCRDLIGIPLNDVLGNPSPDVITPETCAAVAAATLATEMRDNPREKCGYQPALQPESETRPFCGSGTTEAATFSENWEGGSIPEGWTLSENITGDSSEGINWTVSDDLPKSHAGGKAAFMLDSKGGSCAAGGDISGSFRMDSPEISVAEGRAYFKFAHFMQSETGYDGGNLKFSLNGSDFAIVPAEAFFFNGHNRTLKTGGAVADPTGFLNDGNTNPIAGEAAWHGSDEGESTSDWGMTIVDLDALGASAGDKVKFRFEFGQDGCNGNLGWYVDDVSAGYCETSSDGRGNGLVPTPRGGALDGLILLPLLALGLRRRRRHLLRN